MLLPRLLILFIVVPLIELWLLTALSLHIGLGATIGLVLVTGVLGATLARRQGLRTWWAIQQQMARGEVPGAMLVDGLMILIAGLLLITPGILTDAVGLALLIPVVRSGLRRRLLDAFRNSVQVQTFGGYRPETGPSGREHAPGSALPDVIDAEFERRPDR